MAGRTIAPFLAYLRRLHRVGDADQRSDAELLGAFADNNDQDAFAAVVTRHAPLVWGVCRRILGHHQDAEDAFQATFLILARRAGSTRRQASVGGWLHTVAQRLALRARKQAQQRRAREQDESRTSPADSSLHELAAVVDEELRLLPEKYRAPLLLHYLEGETAEAAARQLGISRATFYNRLTRGRELLRGRLSRQGFSLAAPLLVAALMQEAEAAAPSLIQAAIRSVMGSVPERVAALAAEALGITALLKWKIGLMVGLLLGVAAGGVAMLTPRAPMDPIPQAERPAEIPKADERPAARVDRHGDPLPPGAVARLGTLRFRLNTLRVEQLAFAPDGKTLAAASSCGLTLFDAASGKRTKNINPASTGFTRLAYAPDGKRLMTYTEFWTHSSTRKMIVQTWNAADGRKISEMDLEHLCWMGWSAQGEPIAACLGKDEIFYHELKAGKKRRLTAKGLFDPNLVSLCKCVAAKNLLAASGTDGVIHLWNLADGKERFALQPGIYVISLALSADGRRLASVCRDAANKNPVQLWDTTTGKVVRTLPAGHEVFFAPDGKTLALKNWREICFYDAVNGRERSRIRTESHSFGKAFAFAPDSKTFAATEEESGAIQLWNVADGTPKPQPQGHTYHHLTEAAFSPDGKRVASCGGLDGTIRIWDAATGEALVRLHRGGWSRACAFSTDGRTLYSCWLDDKVYFDDAANGRELHTLKVADPDRPKMKPSGLSLRLSDDRARLTIFHTDDEHGMEMLVTVWDAATRKLLFHRRRMDDAYWNALSADGRTLAAAYSGSTLGGGMQGREMGAGPMQLEDTAGGEKLLTFPAVAGQTVPLAFSPDGRLLISATDGTLKSGKRGVTLRLWEVLTATELQSFPTSFSEKAAFTPDGRLLATTTPQGEILLWDLRQGKEHQRLRGFDAQVTALAFSPNGKQLLSGLSDSTLLMWDVTPSAVVARKLDGEGAAKAWADLAGTDAPRAFRARWTLASAPVEALPLLRKHLHPAKAADPQRLHRLLTDLESDTFAVREKAQEELAKLGDLAEPALRKTLENKPTLEVRKRVQGILDHLRGPVTQPELLQSLRAVAVLEDIGTPEVRRLLEELAKGAAEARQTREAKASLRRLDLRKPLER